ncbi:MAG: hypothetical protein AAGJ80_16170, partial [Cyanobacteria bacterium J06553_1]
MPEPDKEKGMELDVYADDVTLLSTHEKVKAAETNAQQYLNQVIKWMKDNNLILADKTQATLFTPDPAEYSYQLNLKIDGTRLKTTPNPKVLGLTFDPKLNFTEHTKLTEEKAKGTLKLVKAISGTDWGQHKETLVSTYKTYTRPVLEYACPAWAPIASVSNVTKLQRVQNAALRCATGHTRDSNATHYHQETQVLPISTHMKLVTSQYRESSRHPQHPMHHALSEPEPERKMKRTAFDTNYVTVVHGCEREGEEEKERRKNQKAIHTAIVQEHILNQPNNPLINAHPPDISTTEKQLPRATRRTLAQLRAQKCPMLQEYLHSIGAAEDPRCPLCGHDGHNTAHLFSCPEVQTELMPIDLWYRPVLVAELLQE